MDTPRRRPKWRFPLLALVVIAIPGALALMLRPPTLPETEPLPILASPLVVERLRPVSDFGNILDTRARSIALFEEAGRVIQHPRCMNCHPRSDQPTQTDAMRVHMPWVSRGVDGGGAATLRCSTCHQENNFNPARVPGHHGWKLAPAEMAWQGKTLGEICKQIQDPLRGGMTADQLGHHMAEDGLVGWAWTPGDGREPAPGSQAEFGALIYAWLETGAECPE